MHGENVKLLLFIHLK